MKTKMTYENGSTATPFTKILYKFHTQYQSLVASLNFDSCLTTSSFVFWPDIPRVHVTLLAASRGEGGGGFIT